MVPGFARILNIFLYNISFPFGHLIGLLREEFLGVLHVVFNSEDGVLFSHEGLLVLDVVLDLVHFFHFVAVQVLPNGLVFVVHVDELRTLHCQALYNLLVVAVELHLNDLLARLPVGLLLHLLQRGLLLVRVRLLRPFTLQFSLVLRHVAANPDGVDQLVLLYVFSSFLPLGFLGPHVIGVVRQAQSLLHLLRLDELFGLEASVQILSLRRVVELVLIIIMVFIILLFGIVVRFQHFIESVFGKLKLVVSGRYVHLRLPPLQIFKGRRSSA